jgi:Flp pilus assembly protein TadD
MNSRYPEKYFLISKFPIVLWFAIFNISFSVFGQTNPSVSGAYTSLQDLTPDLRYEIQKLGRDTINFIRWKKLPIAEKKLQEIATLHSENDEYFYLRAALFFAKKDLNLAEEDLKTALQINPKHEPAYYLLGVIYSLWGNWERAKDAYKASLELSPYNPYYHMNLALVYYALNEQDESKESATKAIEQKANYTEAKHLLILWELQSGSKESAYKSAEKLFKEDQSQREIKFLYAETLFSARQEYQKVIGLLDRERTMPTSTRRVLALSYRKLYNLSQAELHARYVYESSNSTEEDAIFYASILIEQDKFPKADEVFSDLKNWNDGKLESLRNVYDRLLREKFVREKMYYFFPLQ